MNYFPIREKVQLPHQVLLSSNSLLSRETPSLEGSILSNKDFSFGSVIEGVPNSFLWVSYEDTFLRFGFELIRMKLFLISIATPNFKKRQLRFLANHSSHGVVSTDLDGALFNVNAAISNA